MRKKLLLLIGTWLTLNASLTGCKQEQNLAGPVVALTTINSRGNVKVQDIDTSDVSQLKSYYAGVVGISPSSVTYTYSTDMFSYNANDTISHVNLAEFYYLHQLNNN